MINKLYVYALFQILMVSCASVQDFQQRKSISVAAIESSPLQNSKDFVRRTVGSPNETMKIKVDGQTEELWVYSENTVAEGVFQRADFSFDLEGKMVAKAIYPRLHEPESKIENLLKKKYASSKFETFALPRCSDFIPSESMSVDYGQGLSIVFDRESGVVRSLSWETPQKTKELVQAIKKCVKRRTVEP